MISPHLTGALACALIWEPPRARQVKPTRARRKNITARGPMATTNVLIPALAAHAGRLRFTPQSGHGSAWASMSTKTQEETFSRISIDGTYDEIGDEAPAPAA